MSQSLTKRNTWTVQLSEGCGACPFERDGRCSYLMGAPRIPPEGVIDGCPLGDGERITVEGTP